MVLLHYWLIACLRSSMCWQQFTVSSTSSEWLKVTVSHISVILMFSDLSIVCQEQLTHLLIFLFYCCNCIDTPVYIPFSISFSSCTAMWLHLLEINSSSVHMYICVCFIWNVSRLQYSTGTKLTLKVLFTTCHLKLMYKYLLSILPVKLNKGNVKH